MGDNVNVRVLRGSGYLKHAFNRRVYRCISFKTFNNIWYCLLDTQHGMIYFRTENIKIEGF